MRNLAEVIDQMLVYIPKEYEARFKAKMESFKYSAPEMHYLWWEETAMLIELIIGKEINEPWKKSVVDIWMDKK